MSKNLNFRKAKKEKNNEFYTQLPDIENELKHYRKQFRNKVVYCNCDDPRSSNFFHYFSCNFEFLGLKKLITTCYRNQSRDLFSKNASDQAIYMEYNGDKNGNLIPDPEEIEVKDLKGDGDFRSPECIKLLKEADIVVTNPPFSLFREYIAQLMEYDKKFLIMGSTGAVIYKEIFPLMKDDKVWQGHNSGAKWFEVPDDYEIKNKSTQKIVDGKKFSKLGNVVWYTNLETLKRKEDLILHKKYTPEEFPKYDNLNAINVDKLKDIPCDYTGIMGVPITFLDKYNPAQFDILCLDSEIEEGSYLVTPDWEGKIDKGYINGERKYSRILIKRKEKSQ